MGDLLPVAAAVVVAVAVMVAPVVGLVRLLLLAFLGAVVVVPTTLPVPAVGDLHVGIAPGSVALTTYYVALVALFLALPRVPGAGYVGRVAPLAMGGFLVLGLLVLWEPTESRVAGALHVMMMMLALAVGQRLAAWVSGEPARTRVLARLLSAGFVVELLVCLAQTAGVPLSVYDEVAQFIAEGRAIGTFNHPSVLGKIALFCAMIMLPLTLSEDRKVRRHAWIGIVSAILATGLTESRANAAALVVAVVAWIVLQRSGGVALGKRMMILFLFCCAAVPAVLAGMDRYANDPTGGDRGVLLDRGLTVVGNYWVSGLGPNSYVDVVGAYDRFVAAGFPVHNVYLLAISELGVLGAVLLFAPTAVLAAQGMRHFRAAEPARSWALAVLVTLPGLLVVNVTGWGAMAGSVGIVWFFVTGFASHRITGQGDDCSDDRAARTAPSARSNNAPAYVASAASTEAPPERIATETTTYATAIGTETAGSRPVRPDRSTSALPKK